VTAEAVTIGLPLITWERLLLVFQNAYQLDAEPPMGWSEEERKREKRAMFSAMAAVGRQQEEARELPPGDWMVVWDEVDRLTRWKNLSQGDRAAIREFRSVVERAPALRPTFRILGLVKRAQGSVLAAQQQVSAAQEDVGKALKAIFLDGA